MQSPITVGTVLQNRYQILQILGQGGFGRTYLAEDQRRFNELCAIKEFTLTTTDPVAWQKAQELFQREAAILYRIQHPQIPRFRERFEQDQRLFLVQDYVAGKTYHALLDERKAVGGAFTEAEVLQLMHSLLPVLAHIHSLGIIHRDISPDNIILREIDLKPVLIDFGVVKELATRLQSSQPTAPATYVGKLGYSPSEQMQTGQAYPSSDLYALAVTAIVLLTGKEPQELFDQNQFSWDWQRWVTVNPRFALILNRMLSYRPGDRFQTAAEVLQALDSPQQPVAPTLPPIVPPPQPSNVQTVAVGGGRPDQVAPPSPDRGDRNIPEPPTQSVLDNPLAIGAITIAVIILAGVGSWALVRSLRGQDGTTSPQTPPQTFPSPVITGGTSPTPTPTPTETEPAKRIRRLNFDASNTAQVEDNIKANEIVQYTFRGERGQQLTALLAQESGVLLTVLAPNGEPIENSAQEVTFYQGKLPVTGRYTIELSLPSGVLESDYSLNVELEVPVQPIPTERPTQTPTERPTITPTPTPTETLTPTPTETPTPTPTETLTPTPTETPTEKPPTSPDQDENNQPTDGTSKPDGLQIPLPR